MIELSTSSSRPDRVDGRPLRAGLRHGGGGGHGRPGRPHRARVLRHRLDQARELLGATGSPFRPRAAVRGPASV